MFWNWTFCQDVLCVRVRSNHIRHHSASLNKFLWRNYYFSALCLNVHRIIRRLCLIIPCNQSNQHIGLDYAYHQGPSAGLYYALQPESSAQFIWIYILTRIISRLCLSIRCKRIIRTLGLLQPESSAHCSGVYVVTRVCSTFFLNIRFSRNHQQIVLDYTLQQVSPHVCCKERSQRIVRECTHGIQIFQHKVCECNRV